MGMISALKRILRRHSERGSRPERMWEALNRIEPAKRPTRGPHPLDQLADRTVSEVFPPKKSGTPSED